MTKTDVQPIWVPVAEIRDLVDLFENSPVTKRLSGRQRKDLDEAVRLLRGHLAERNASEILVPVTELRAILRAAAASQSWLQQQFEDFDLMNS